MRVIEASSADQALERGLRLLKYSSERRETRCGPALVSPDPVTTLYVNPSRRVLLHPWRDANPFFHLMEGLWMLAGRRDVASLLPFNARLAEFSDDGETFHGAYGRRWRFWPDEASEGCYDQLRVIVERLRSNPGCRRQILQMWDPALDLGYVGKDAPCNLCVHLQRDSTGRLDMTVFCRSNDAVWGAYGSDVVTFSLLQEYLAAAIGCSVGRYWQVSDNFHGYVSTAEPLLAHVGVEDAPDRYETPDPWLAVNVYPLVHRVEQFDAELGVVFGDDRDLAENPSSYEEPFLRRVVAPMLQAWRCVKDETTPDKVLRYESALMALGGAARCDWRSACEEWLRRRVDRCLSK